MGIKIKPDRQFIKEVMENGGDSVKKCFQCANCTAVCELSSGDAPFPRRQMQLAAWGLKEKLAEDPAVWYCHQCRDCSAHCPRNAKPADAIGAIRLSLIKHFATPSFFGNLLSKPSMVWLVFLIPILVVSGLVFLGKLHPAGSESANPEYAVHFGQFIPHWAIYLFGLIVILAVGGAVNSAIKFWKGINKAHPGDRSKGEGFVSALIGTAIDLFAHKRFSACEENSKFKLLHMLIFFGFAGLFIVTSVVAPLAWLGKYPFYSYLNPLKIAGNLAGIALLIGCIGAIINRLSATDKIGKGSYQDWLLLITLTGVTITGMATQIFRIPLDIPVLAYSSYFLHMVFIFVLLVFMPYSKFAHIYYRFLALLHARMTGLKLGEAKVVEQSEPAEVAQKQVAQA